jgi:hypothetical protein
MMVMQLIMHDPKRRVLECAQRPAHQLPLKARGTGWHQNRYDLAR